MAALPWERKPIHVKFRSQDLSKSKEFFRTFECEEYKILSSQAISGVYNKLFKHFWITFGFLTGQVLDQIE